MVSFPVPSSIQDLERAPYDLLPYPEDFDDDNEAARADSFASLVTILQQGNRAAFDDDWLDDERVQALYTLVRYV